jgi:hypothetical protein
LCFETFLLDVSSFSVALKLKFFIPQIVCLFTVGLLIASRFMWQSQHHPLAGAVVTQAQPCSMVLREVKPQSVFDLLRYPTDTRW